MIFVLFWPAAIMKNFAQQILYFYWLRRVLYDGPMFFVIVRRQEEVALFINIAEREKQKRKYKSFKKNIYKELFKSYTAIAVWRHALPKWSHCKMTFLFVSWKFKQVSLVRFKHIQAINTIVIVYSICSSNTGHNYRTDLASSIGT